MGPMTDCIFCDILAGRAPASFVYEDEATAAFMDISTLNTGQVVVVPRAHAPYLKDLDEATGQLFFRAAQRVCAGLRRSGLPMDAVNLFLADGAEAGQEIFHVHFLVIPRLAGDDMKVHGTWWGPPRADLNEAATHIRRACQTLYPGA